MYLGVLALDFGWFLGFLGVPWVFSFVTLGFGGFWIFMLCCWVGWMIFGGFDSLELLGFGVLRFWGLFPYGLAAGVFG